VRKDAYAPVRINRSMVYLLNAREKPLPITYGTIRCDFLIFHERFVPSITGCSEDRPVRFHLNYFGRWTSHIGGTRASPSLRVHRDRMQSWQSANRRRKTQHLLSGRSGICRLPGNASDRFARRAGIAGERCGSPPELLMRKDLPRFGRHRSSCFNLGSPH
jgi:hypothetical protein